MLLSLSTRLLKIYCTKWYTWYFRPCVKSPQSPGKIPILAFQCESMQKVWLGNCVQTPKLRRAVICSLRWGVGILLWTSDLSCLTLFLFSTQGQHPLTPSGTVWIHGEGEKLVCSQLGHDYIHLQLPGFEDKIPTCGLHDSGNTSQCLLAGLGCWAHSMLAKEEPTFPVMSSGALENLNPYEAMFIRQYGVIPASQYLVGRETNLKGSHSRNNDSFFPHP